MQKTLKKTQKGFTLIELLIVIAVIAILAAIAIPNLLASRKAANESSAISSVRTLITAQETYRSRKGEYAATTTVLQGAGLIDTTLDSLVTTGGKSGFLFAVSSGATGTPEAKVGYTITAHPVATATGTRSFFADQSGVIRSKDTADASQTADAASTPID